MSSLKLTPIGGSVGEVEIKELPLDQLEMADWNPNQMPVDKFNALFSNMKEVGVIEPIVVTQVSEGKYLVVGGHHRLKAAKLMNLDRIPCVIKYGMTTDDVKVQNMRLNVLKGKIDPEKFTSMYEELQSRYPDKDVAALLGITSKSELDKLIVQYEKELPEDMKEAFRKAKSKIKTVEDLVLILNELFDKQGDQLEVFGYMILDFNGKESIWVRLRKEDIKYVNDVTQLCHEKKVSMDSLVRVWLKELAIISDDDWKKRFSKLPRAEMNPKLLPLEEVQEEHSAD